MEGLPTGDGEEKGYLPPYKKGGERMEISGEQPVISAEQVRELDEQRAKSAEAELEQRRLADQDPDDPAA